MAMFVTVFAAALIGALVGSVLAAIIVIRALTWGLKDELKTYGDAAQADNTARA